MPRIQDVRISDIDKTKAVTIVMRYRNLRPQPQNPEDHDSDHPVEDESPESQTAGEDSPPPGDDDDTESPKSGKDTQAKANAKCALAFPKEEEGQRSAEAEKRRKHAANAKTSNERNNRTLKPAVPPEDDQAAVTSGTNGTNVPTGDTRANAVTPASPV